MKTCKYCGLPKDENDFHVAANVKGKVYRRLKCSSCYKEMKKNRRLKIRDDFKELKSSLKCEKCGFSDPRVLQFHHKDPSMKEGDISSLVSGGRWSWERIKEEMEKCSILCANCHQIETIEQRGVV